MEPYIYHHQPVKPEPNMLKILPIIPSRTSQKLLIILTCIIAYYPQIILYALYISSGIDIQRNTDLIHILSIV